MNALTSGEIVAVRDTLPLLDELAEEMSNGSQRDDLDATIRILRELLAETEEHS